MRFLQVGLGSMGKRRIRNIQALGAGEIIAFDPREDRRAEAERLYGVRTVATIAEGMAQNPDALIISTPPDKHLPYELVAVREGKHFFCEAGVLTEGMDELIALCQGRDVVAAPSCTLRFHPSVKRLKQIVEERTIGDIACFTYHSGQYLPDWHPWEDYRSFYVAKRETGACREIVPFELVWLTWVLGPVSAISCFKDKLTRLDIDIDDAYQIIMRFAGGTLGHLLVDVISRVPFRQFKMISEDGVATWDWATRMVRVYTAHDGKWQEFPEGAGFGGFSLEGMYVDEMARFVAAVRGEAPYGYTLAEDRMNLDLLVAAETGSSAAVATS